MSATPPFAALPAAPGLARGHVRATLAEWGLGEFADTAELIASEMTANAVNASAPVQATGTVLVIRLCLVTHGHVLTIECWDQAPGIPVLQEASGFAETGRGLAIIDSLTDGAWGCPACHRPSRQVRLGRNLGTQSAPHRSSWPYLDAPN